MIRRSITAAATLGMLTLALTSCGLTPGPSSSSSPAAAAPQSLASPAPTPGGIAASPAPQPSLSRAPAPLIYAGVSIKGATTLVSTRAITGATYEWAINGKTINAPSQPFLSHVFTAVGTNTVSVKVTPPTGAVINHSVQVKTGTFSTATPATVQPTDASTQINGAKVVSDGKTLKISVPNVPQTDTVGVRYVLASVADPWNAKPVGYGISTARAGDVFTISSYAPIPAGTYHILIVDSKLHHAVVTAKVS